jgi:hypothetical protein
LIGTPASACFRKPITCSSVYLLFLMSVILRVDGLHFLYAGTAGGGQVKEAAQDSHSDAAEVKRVEACSELDFTGGRRNLGDTTESDITAEAK